MAGLGANVGKSGSSFTLGVYLSTNDYISKYDTFLGSLGYYMSAHSEWDWDKSFTIPGSVAPGTYYLGVVLDPDDTLSETRESNNRLVFPGT